MSGVFMLLICTDMILLHGSRPIDTGRKKCSRISSSCSHSRQQMRTAEAFAHA